MAETRFHSLLRAKIKDAVDNRAMSLVHGHCADYPQYQYNVGYVLGLEAALKLCEEIEMEFNE